MAKRKRPLKRRMAYLLLHLFILVIAGLVYLLPLGWLRRLATAIAYLICVCVPSRLRLAQENLRKAFGDRFSPAERRRIARQAAVNISKTMIELLKMRHLTPQQVGELVSVRGAEHLRAALDRGKGVILLTAHFGNWEIGGARLVADGFPLVAIARDANEELAARLINQARERHGELVLSREDLRETLRALRNNQCLAILPDQHAARGGIVVEFLGRPAATATGVATLAVRTGCAVVPLFGPRRPDDTIDGYVLPPVELIETGDRDKDIRANTQLFNDIIGEQISKRPEQWLWLHDRWKVAENSPGR